MKPFLSICIPTYNRGKIVYRTVSNILKSSREDIEVVVSNNCSTDDTEELLLQIKDSRFKYFKNDYNNGADNLVSVLTYAQGEYLLLQSDEDEIVLANLPKYISVLREHSPAVLLGTAAVDRKRYIYNGLHDVSLGYPALDVYGFGNTYMSGYIYNAQILKKVLDGTRGADINRKFGYWYNFTDLTRRMLQYGRYMTLEEVITFQREHGKRDERTHFEDGICCASPENKVLALFDAVDDFHSINILTRDKYRLIEKYINQILIERSIGDYINTISGEGERQMRLENEPHLREYYQKNLNDVVGIKFWRRLHRNWIKCNKYIEKSKIFPHRYWLVRLLYMGDSLKIWNERRKRIKEFAYEKYILEMNL